MSDLMTIQDEGQSLVLLARAVTIETAENAEYASAFLSTVKALGKRIADFMAPSVEAAHKAHKAAKAQEKELLAPVEEAERIIKAALADWSKREAARLAREAEEERKAMEAIGITEAPPASAEPVKVAGISFVETWSAEVYDIKALAMAVADGRAPVSCIEANVSTLGAMARALKSEMAIPGVRAVKTESVRGRA